MENITIEWTWIAATNQAWTFAAQALTLRLPRLRGDAIATRSYDCRKVPRCSKC
jgi:hypothetical protein